ncbi:MAG: hypothetical protein ACK4NP_06680 [Parvularculaceae bacterium]
MAPPVATDASGKPSTARAAAFFALFAIAPGLLYQYVQDHGRVLGADAQGLARLALDVAPNALGALAASSAIFIMAVGIARNAPPVRTALVSAAIGVSGLLAWEIAQIAIPAATFDLQDIAWTLVGGVAFLLAAVGVFRSPAKKETRR